MDETIGAKHLRAVNQMFATARANAENTEKRLENNGQFREETLKALKAYLNIALAPGDPDSIGRQHRATTEILNGDDGDYGDVTSRARAIRIGRGISLFYLRSARRVTLAEDSFDSLD